MSQRHKNSQQRRQIAHTAARLLIEDPTLGRALARRKAAEQFGIANSRDWPSMDEITECLFQEQRMFCPHQPIALHNLRTQALAAMRHFEQFQPRLVGQVMEGTANYKNCVYLHLFTDNSESIILTLLEQRIPYAQRERFLRYSNGLRTAHATFSFIAGGVDIELIALPLWAQRNPPLNSINERPERGMDANQLSQLI